MADEKAPSEKQTSEHVASEAIISLSQALLAPLDAIFKAQLHAARSFLNMLLQLGYPHKPLSVGGVAAEASDDRNKPYSFEFQSEIMIDGQRRLQKISIPALALVPLAPLAVDSSKFKFSMMVQQIGDHRQIQESEKDTLKKEDESFSRHKRPWFLVDNPISVRGVLGGPQKTESPQERTQESMIQIEVNVSRIPIPAGLEKLVTSLTQSASVSDVTKVGKAPNQITDIHKETETSP